MADVTITAGIDLKVNADAAKTQLQSLQQQLQQIANIKIDASTGTLTQDIQAASQAAMQLSAHLATATNQKTGNLDFTKFYSSIQKSGSSLEEYGAALQKMGPAGQKAFVNLADSISKSEIPLKRTSQLMDGMWANLKKTIGWQISSSMVNSFVGSMQQAVGYAKDLNSSLTDIRIVTGSSAEQMASFAQEANNAAKKLSTTTTDYTRASLIYYQQGLSNAEVKARTEATIKMANATGTSASKVSDQMTAVWNNFYDGSKSLEYYQDVMTALGAATASSTDEISEGVNKFAATAKTVGLSYEYATAGLATVTARTRESADVVGNAFKTLFARIQGLSLGETLDDGTDLNKYSLALAKVGVAVKDSSGELRAMDDILDDLGNTWDTLSTAQQTALAQTVGGVRQYSQLMALMNHWDYFKENVQVAKSSEGTLDQQAAIYAESWQAASDRVRASWEGLWDSLIDSDGFIGALDMLSGFVDILNDIVTGMGGVSGVLTTFGGVLTRVFSKQITGTIQDVGYGLSMLTKAGRNKMTEKRNSFVDNAIKQIDADTYVAVGKENEYTARQESMRQSLGLSRSYQQNANRLSETQLLQYEMQRAALEKAQQASIETSAKYDVAKSKRSDLYLKTLENGKLNSGLGGNSSQELENKITANEIAIAQKQKKIKELEQKSQTALNKKTGEKSKIKVTSTDSIKALQSEIKGLEKENQEYRTERQGFNNNLSDKIVNRNQQDQEDSLQYLQSKQQRVQTNMQNILESSGYDTVEKLMASNKAKDKKSQEDYQKASLQNNSYEASMNRIKDRDIQQVNTYSKALTQQADAAASFESNLKSAFASNDMEKFNAAMGEFQGLMVNDLSNSEVFKILKEISEDSNITNLQEALAERGIDSNNAAGIFNGLFKDAINKTSGSIFDELSKDNQAKFGSKEAFQQAILDSYGDTSKLSEEQRQRAEEARQLTDSAQETLNQESRNDLSGTERLVRGASGAMQGLAAGESLNAFFTSINEGTVTLASSLSSIASVSLNAVSGFDSLKTSLTGLAGLGSGAAGWISAAITGITLVASSISDWVDTLYVSAEEHQQNLQTSSQELDTSVSATSERIEIVKSQNEDYLEGIKKINSLSQDPTTLTKDIYESNKKALNLIQEYGLDSSQYATESNGLINIDKQVLKDAEVQSVKNNTVAQYANLLADSKQQLTNAMAEGYEFSYDARGYGGITSKQAKIMEQYGANFQSNGMVRKYTFTPEQFTDFVASDDFNELLASTSGNAYNTLIDWASQYQDIKLNQEQYNSSKQTVANKILSEEGYDTSDTGYSAKASILSKKIEDKMTAEGNWLDPMSTKDLSNEQRLEAEKIIGNQYGLSNIKITGVNAKGEIEYQQGDDESTAGTITRESLNGFRAAQKVLDSSNSLVQEANAEYEKNYVNSVGEEAAEAAANLGEFGTAAGASAASLIALNNTADKENTEITNSEGITKTVSELLANSGSQAQIDTISEVSETLGLGEIDGVLDKTSVETLTTLGKLMESGDNAEGLSNLFNGIIEATGDNDPEKAAALLTALANTDFSENDYLNANNLLNTLQEFGYSVDEGNLPEIYAWIAAIVGLGAGEDLASSANKITENRNVLNKVTPGGTVDAATKQAAAEAGLTNNWVKTGDDEYTYVGTQEDIDTAKSNANKAFTQTQKDIDTAQASYSVLESNGYLKGISNSYDNVLDVASALGIKATWNKGDKKYDIDTSSVDSDQLEAIATALKYNDAGDFAEDLLNGEGLGKFNKFMADGSTTPQDQDAQLEDYLASIETAQDMMQAINDGTAGVVETIKGPNGTGIDIVTDEALDRLEAMPGKSDELTAALDTLRTAQENLVEAQSTGLDVVAAQEEYNNALFDTQLISQLDAIAEATGYSSAEMQNYIKELQSTQKVQQLATESTSNYAKRLTALALEYQKNSEGLKDLQTAYKSYKSAMNSGDEQSKAAAFTDMQKAISKITRLPINKVTKEFVEQAKTAGILEKALKGDVKAIAELEDLGRMQELTDATTDAGKALQTVIKDLNYGEGIEGAKNFVSELNSILAQTDMGQMISDVNKDTARTLGALFDAMVSEFGGGTEGLMKAAQAMNNLGIGVKPTDAANSDTNVSYAGTVTELEPDGYGGLRPKTIHAVEQDVEGEGSATGLQFYDLGGGGGSPGGGGGGGGGGKEPKKVANKRKSQTVKRYKRNDYKKSTNKFAKSTEENKKDYLYGEQKIAQLQKINKLTEKEAHLNADRIKEARAYLEEDRNNLQKYLQKYGYDMKLEADGYLSNYEEIWTDIYNQIAALYEDNLLDESESELEEQLKVMQEELEGALEDYEDSLQELYDTIEAYEDSLYEMYDNQVEQIEHRIEFKTELDTDQLDYMDFILETIGDNAERAVDAIDAMGQKTSTLLDGINTYNDAIASAYEISDSPLQTLITNGVEGLLTEKQVELLRDSRDGLTDYMTQLLELRESVMEKLTEAFDTWNEKMQSSLTTIEHYGSVLEYFKNIVDVVGKDVFGLSDKFMDNLEQSAIDQANDNLEATRANYLGLLEEYEYANEQLALARERNDESSITQWEETVRTVKEEMESAEESMMTALENTLTLIAEQFETAMQRAVDAFNDAIYAHNGLEGLSNDYSLIRENAELMAEDYEKIYNLSKLNRDITKTLDDTKIIAGKSRLINLQKEINELQKSNVELSQYDLEYLQAKYDLRLAEIELENAQNAKSQVRLSKDSEGNWSYVYTQSTDAVEEAEQKYEDALYAMQELSQEYLEEMSSKMVDTSSAMMDEISALRIQDFNSYEDYQAEIKAIQDKYAESLRLQENELNKAINNSSDLYKNDWQAYSQYTGYKISAADDWVDTFRESTLGGLLDADTLMSNFGDTILGLADELNKKLATAGSNYFSNVEDAMIKYGTSIDGFKTTVTTATGEISTKSKDATQDVKDMATEMTKSFKEVADSVSNWQIDFSLKIDELLDEVKTMIESINEAIKKSAELTTDNVNYDLIGAADAIDLINASGKFGTWSTGSGGNGVYVDGKSTAFVDYLSKLVEDMDDAMELYYNTSSKDTSAKAEAKEKLENAILLYNEFKSIVDRLYDVSDTNMPKSKYSDKTASMDTGGYTGEWGNSGKLAMLHEKELVLNKNDTRNFLEAIGISRDLVNSVIELNARSSGMGLGALMANGAADNAGSQVLEQHVTINADFPSVIDHNEIAEALSDLTNLASQYANRS